MSELSKVWSDAEREAWSPPGHSSPSEFAAKTRFMTEKESAFPGMWDNARSPYLAELMDNPARLNGPKLTVITKPAQVGASECTRNLIRYWAHHDPGPCLIVYPDVNTAKSQFVERLVPLFEKDGLLIKFNHNEGLISVSLQSMDIYITWASNAARLSSRPIKYLIMDELDKMRFPSTARERAPVALALARLRTFKRAARAVLLSTPTFRDGPIYSYYERCGEKREWRIPCLKCDEFFYPSWSCVEWDDRREGEDDIDWSNRIESEGSVWIKCPHCEETISEWERDEAVTQGKWFSITASQNSSKVGYRFGVLGTGWSTLGELAAKWIEIHTDPERLQEFINQDLGEVYEEKSSVLNSTRLSECVLEDHPREVAPKWVGAVIAGADSQLDGWYWVTRGYGAGKRSILLDYGFAHTFEQLKAATLDNSYLVSGTSDRIGVSCMGIDARGSPEITETVFGHAIADRRIRPLMGVDRMTRRGGDPVKEVPWQFELRRKDLNTVKWLSGKRYSVDVNYFKNLLVAHIAQGLWLLPEGMTQEYYDHFKAESKVKVVKRGVVEWVWKKKSDRAPNHWWDAEVYCEALAWRLRLEFVPEEHVLDHQRRARSAVSTEEVDEGKWIEGFQH